jgi:hypothetical protein
MHRADRSSSPEQDRAGRRTLFSGRGRAVPDATSADDAALVEQLMGAYQSTIQRQLEEGLSEIRRTANSLMHEIASEVWRAAGGDKGEVRSRILQELSRDQAIRSLIAHADERFQALSVRTARLEDTLNMVAESLRGAREQLATGGGEPGAPAAGDEALRAQLSDVTRQVAAALGMLAERDQAIVDAVRTRVREHGELITQETTRIAHAMEGYVQHGVEAIGQLAGTMETQVRAMGARDQDVAARVEEAVQEQMTLLGEQLHLMYERLAIDTTSITESVTHLAVRGEDGVRAVGEYLHLLQDRVDVVTRDAVAELNRTLEERVMGLARLVRADAEALRGELVRTAETQDAGLARMLDEQFASVSDAVAAGAARIVEELGRRMREETEDVVRSRIDEAFSRLQTHTDERSQAIDGRMDQALGAIDRNMIRMTGAVESQLERLERSVGDRAGQAADLAIGERFDDVLARLHEATGTIEGHRRETEQALDERMASLARLIRSDNETLAQQIVADQDASKQALRAMKELQANLPSEVIDMVERRFASLAESIERSNELLCTRIDRMAERLGERYGNDIQVVIDRMGDAMHALAGLGRADTAQDATRIDLE